MRMRLTVNSMGDRAEELGVAADVRQELLAHAPVEIDPTNPVHGIHRDVRGRAYFEFSTESLQAVEETLARFGQTDRFELTQPDEDFGESCHNCGNIAGAMQPAVCTNCGFHDISPCPVCAQPIPRQQYARLGSNLFRCPECGSRVQLRFNEPIVLSDGTYNQPLVVVEEVEVRAR